jgi:hypothetical protein
MEVDAKGNVMGVHHSTIGEACFDLIQNQVEGNWPKAYASIMFFRQRTSSVGGRQGKQKR